MGTLLRRASECGAVPAEYGVPADAEARRAIAQRRVHLRARRVSGELLLYITVQKYGTSVAVDVWILQ